MIIVVGRVDVPFTVRREVFEHNALALGPSPSKISEHLWGGIKLIGRQVFPKGKV